MWALTVICLGGCNMAIRGVPTVPIRPTEIKGLNQSIAEQLMSIDYSPDCQNIDTSEGIISVRRGSTKLDFTPVADMTLRKMYRWEGENASTRTIIAGFDDGGETPSTFAWYYLKGTSGTWVEIVTDPGGASLTALNPFYTDATMARISDQYYMLITGYVFDATVKIYWDGVDEKFYWDDLGGTPPAGYAITTHRERVWQGNIGTTPNKIAYSKAFYPEDWTTAGETGEIDIETFDGDDIMTIENVFDDVLIFKRNTIWRVLGDVPADYETARIYSVKGTLAGDTVCHDGNLCFFMSDDGVYQYDGNTAFPVLTDAIKDYMAAAILTAPGEMACELINHKMFIFEQDTIGTATYVGQSLVYDVITKKVEVIKMQDVTAICSSEVRRGEIEMYYSDGSYVYYFDKTKLLWGTLDIDAYWYTPEMDFGMPNASKTLTEIYINGYGTTSAGVAGGQLKVTIYYNESGTEKTKTKTITLQTTSKTHTIPIGVTGRIFKFKFENVDGSAFHMLPTFIYEVDKD